MRGTTMMAALTQMENAVTALAAAYATYKAECLAAQRVAYAATGRTDILEHMIGLARVDRAIAARMATLGVERVLDCARTQRPFGEEWVSSLAAQITRLVGSAGAGGPHDGVTP